MTDKITDINKKQYEILEPTEYRIFCDLDRVLVDFESYAREIAGGWPSDAEKDPQLKKLFWKKIMQHTAAGHSFFANMKPMPHALHLWNYIKKYDPVILSATGHLKGAADEKRMWVRSHLGTDAADKAIFVVLSREKAQYAAPNHILIDDRQTLIGPWEAAGGIGILYENAAQTIYKLKELGL